MLRSFHYKITTEENLTIGEYLRNCGYSHHILTHLKRTPRGILLNGEWAPAGRVLHTGDLLDIRLEEPEESSHLLPCPVPFTVIYEDEDLLVVDKPSDTPIHPSINNHENTLANGVVWYYQQQGLPFVYRCVNRLDRDTSGLLIIAKNALSASLLSLALKERRIHRTYLAIVEGRIDIPGTVNVPIGRKPGSALERCVNFDNGAPAVTHYCPLAYRRDLDLTLLSLQLETGRTHQIRVHMGYLSHPLIGDYLYHPRRDLIGRQALHSWKLTFCHPITKEPLNLQAPLPTDMQFILTGQTAPFPAFIQPPGL